MKQLNNILKTDDVEIKQIVHLQRVRNAENGQDAAC